MTISQQIKSLFSQIPYCMVSKRYHFRQRLQQLQQNIKKSPHPKQTLKQLQQDITQSVQIAQRRAQNLPQPNFNNTLPVIQKLSHIQHAIAQHSVIIIAGETGSGKTTQLPQICLSLQRGVFGQIAHTQPRRIAARSVANRIAEELNIPLGTAIGYKIRFQDKSASNTYVKVMTDGILLAEIQHDHYLQHYDTLIIDEAHERSLNIDFLLGYIKRILPKRPELKVIITSATIDTEKFSHFFDNAPIITVSGRTYPVEIRYRPYQSADKTQNSDLHDAIIHAVDELSLELPGDILIFLSSEREIREISEELRKHHPAHTEILPLFSRLSTSQQQQIFHSHTGRRIILSTNIAETSLTVPGIRYVIDSGYARISRYSTRSKVQRLPIEKISQASANQRSGRCGRITEGICIRLYDEDDFKQRPAFTDPEILRTNLAQVILQMQALKLGDVKKFSFLQAPENKQINDAYRLLEELGALKKNQNQHRIYLTPIGKKLGKFPLDPRISRMLIAADQFASLQEVLIIASALSIQDPRERPLDQQQAADQKQQKYQDNNSDFLSYLKLWQDISEQRKHLSHRKLRKYCQEHYLSFNRLQEWRDIHQQLYLLCQELSLQFNTQAASYDAIHQSLLTGLLSNIAHRSKDKEYLGTRNTKLVIFPGSGVKYPKWIMAAEMVATSRLYARCVAKIDPQWLIRLAQPLLQHHYFEPFWDAKAAQVSAFERLTLYGLTIQSKRKINYGPIAPTEARELFIREALIHQNYHSNAPFFQHNKQLISKISVLEHKSRRPDILVNEETLYAFFDPLIPDKIYSGANFEKWRKSIEKETPRLLFLNEKALMQHQATTVTDELYPNYLHYTQHGMHIDIPLEYHFSPGHPLDGITAHIPLSVLAQLPQHYGDWLVPGLIREKLTTLLKGLNKSLRRHFVPVPDYITHFLSHTTPDNNIALIQTLSDYIYQDKGITIPLTAWQEDSLATHLRMNFRLLDSKGIEIDSSRNLHDLQQHYFNQAQNIARTAKNSIEQENITQWNFGDLPELFHYTQQQQKQSIQLTAYPALQDMQNSVAIRLFSQKKLAQQNMKKGLRRLFILHLGKKYTYLRKNILHIQDICLAFSQVLPCKQLTEDILHNIIDFSFKTDHAIYQQPLFMQRLQQGEKQLIKDANSLCQKLFTASQHYPQIMQLAKSLPASASKQDINSQLEHLIHPQFITKTPYITLQRFNDYFQGILLRIEKLQHNPQREKQLLTEFQLLWDNFWQYHTQYPEKQKDLHTYRWQLEELRLALFAQPMKTLAPVSVKRLKNAWQKLTS